MSGSLPRLKLPILDTPIQSGAGEFADPCDSCALADVCVKGCCQSSCRQSLCYRDCNNCGGAFYEEAMDGTSGVPAVCSKSPLRELYLKMVRKEEYEFTKRKRIRRNTKAIIITQGSAGKSNHPLYSDAVDTIAVNIRHVWSSRGWFSRDMRDYLRVPADKKLILLTSTHDDVLERAWDAGVYEDDIGSLGFDYWHPLDFSAYPTMSRFNNLWVSYRCLYVAERMQGHFSSYAPDEVRSELLTEDSPWVQASVAAPNILVHLQFANLKVAKARDYIVSVLARLRNWQKVVPRKLSFWFIGVVSAELVYNLQHALPDSDCYFMAVNPWLAAFKGDEFTRVGKLKKSKLPRAELVLKNQNNYASLIADAIEAATTH